MTNNKNWERDYLDEWLAASIMMNQGKIDGQVISGLIEKGMTRSDASELVDYIRSSNSRKEKQRAMAHIGGGCSLALLTLCIGTVIFRLSPDLAYLSSDLCLGGLGAASLALIWRGIRLYG